MNSLVRCALILGSIAVTTGAFATDEPSLETRFDPMAGQFLKQNCLACHGPEKPKGKLDLSVYGSVPSIVKDYKVWGLVRERLEARRDAARGGRPQPTEMERRTMVAWITALLDREAQKNAGDPGPVLARRLNNAELDYTIADLTGVDIRADQGVSG